MSLRSPAEWTLKAEPSVRLIMLHFGIDQLQARLKSVPTLQCLCDFV